MGRKTWDSIPAPFRPLPGRRNIVITRQAGWVSVGAEAAHSVEEALHLCQGERRVWVIGGGQIYEQAMPYADLVEMTQIDVAPKGDTQAPKLDDEWERQTVSEWRSSRSGLRYRFATYVRHLPSKTLETGFGSSQIPTEFPITQAPTDFGHTETDTDTDTGADTETETETPTGFTHTEAPSGFASTLPPGFTP
jgi:dihydrofolate reductase